VSGGRDHRHVGADLGDDHFGRAALDAGDVLDIPRVDNSTLNCSSSM
jgi:hypothetical protein